MIERTPWKNVTKEIFTMLEALPVPTEPDLVGTVKHDFTDCKKFEEHEMVYV